MSAAALSWRVVRWADLSRDDLYDALALRCAVFVVEQGPYLDPDGLDRHALHVLGRAGDGTLQAYLRVVAPGHKYEEPSIGRVVTAAPRRGTGQGRVLMQQGLQACEAAWPGRAIRISAQAHLQRFYASLGFEPVGEPYLEDEIPHIEMLRPAR